MQDDRLPRDCSPNVKGKTKNGSSSNRARGCRKEKFDDNGNFLGECKQRDFG